MTTSSIPIILKGLVSESEAERQAAESSYEAICQEPQIISALLDTVAREVGVVERSMAAVLLRRAIARSLHGHKLWNHLPVQDQASCQSKLLHLLGNGALPLPMRNKIADAVAEAGRAILAMKQTWPQLTTSLVQGAFEAQLVLRIMGELPEVLEPLSAPQLQEFLSGFLGHAEVEIRVLALKSLEAILEELDDAKLAALLPLISKLDSVLSLVLSSEDPELMTDALNAVAELIVTRPKLFKGIAVGLAGALSALVSNSELDEDVRGAAVEVVLCICECLPALVKKDKQLVANLSQAIFRLICEVEDDPEWYTVDPDSEDSDELDPIGILGEQAMDRFALALGGKALLEPLFSRLIAAALNDRQHWQARYGALKSIASAAEGCAEVLGEQLSGLMSLIWPCFQDQAPRVQYAACHALGQLCTDFNGTLQEMFCQEALGCLVQVLGTSTQPRVQQHAAAALVNFAEGVDQKALEPFLGDLVERLITLISTQSQNLPLQQQLIATLASFSGAAGTRFAQHYDRVVPLLLICLRNVNDAKFRMLQCRALEAISLIAHAVGKERFLASPSGQPFLQAMVSLTQQQNAEDTLLKDFLPAAWVRMCQILKDDFAPFLPVILPEMRRAALQEADIALLDADQPIDPETYNEDEWDFTNCRGRQLGIRTSGLEEKNQAVENLGTILQSMSIAAVGLELCKDLHDQVFRPLLAFELHESVQAGAADGLVAALNLLLQANPHDPAFLEDVQVLMEASVKHYSGEFGAAAIDAVATLVDEHPALCAGINFADWLNKMAVLTSQMIKERTDGDDNEEEDDDLGENAGGEEEDVLYATARLIGTLNRRQIPIIAEALIETCLKPLAKQSRNNSLLHHAMLCVLDDLIRARAVANHFAALWKFYLKSLSSEDPDVLQAAVYGIGQAAVNGYSAQAVEQIHALLKIMHEHNESLGLRDNVASALARIMQSCNYDWSLVQQLYPLWIKSFPVITDSDEVVHVYQTLVHLLRMYPQQLSLDRAVLQAPLDKGFEIPEVSSYLSN